jgi:stress response protein SCP2
LATLELAWDVTNGLDIDLDASAICLDKDLNFIDSVWYRKLQSQYGSIWHHRDEQEGNELGDEAKKGFRFAHFQYIGFVINFFICQELHDVSLASFHVFDPKNNADICSRMRRPMLPIRTARRHWWQEFLC